MLVRFLVAKSANNKKYLTKYFKYTLEKLWDKARCYSILL